MTEGIEHLLTFGNQAWRWRRRQAVIRLSAQRKSETMAMKYRPFSYDLFFGGMEPGRRACTVDICNG